MYSNEKWPFGQYPLHENTLQLGKCLTSQGVGLSTGAETSDIPFIVLHIKQPLRTYWLEFEIESNLILGLNSAELVPSLQLKQMPIKLWCLILVTV